MDLRRLRVGEWLLGACGLLLLVALFLPWYRADGDTLTAWQALSLLDILLLVLALAALAVAGVTATHRVQAVPLALESLTTLFAALGALLVLIRVLNLPGDADGREWGLWLGLAATLGSLAAGLAGMRDERNPRAVPPAIERMPAPPEAGS